MERIVIASDKNLKQFTDYQVKRFEELGYDYKVYDLGGLGYGEPFKISKGDLNDKTQFIPCVFKPSIIKLQLEELKDKDCLIYLDVDAILNRRLDLDWEFDIGITIRFGSEIRQFKDRPHVGAINSGVLFFRNSKRTRDFVDLWLDVAKEKNGDQIALNHLLMPVLNLGSSDCTVKSFNLSVRQLPCQRYNNYYTRDARPYITHFKGRNKESFNQWLK